MTASRRVLPVDAGRPASSLPRADAASTPRVLWRLSWQPRGTEVIAITVPEPAIRLADLEISTPDDPMINASSPPFSPKTGQVQRPMATPKHLLPISIRQYHDHLADTRIVLRTHD